MVDAFLEANDEWSDGMTKTQIKNLEDYQGDLKNQTDEIERQVEGPGRPGDLDAMSSRRSSKRRPPPARRPRSQGAAERPEPASRSTEYKMVRQELTEVELELAEAEAWLTAAQAAAERAAGKNPTPVERRGVLKQQIDRRFQMDPEVQRSRRRR